MSAAERNRATKRFVRLEASRSTAGHGLGLSLVKAIATVHHAALAIEDNAPGLQIRVSFTRLSHQADLTGTLGVAR